MLPYRRSSLLVALAAALGASACADSATAPGADVATQRKPKTPTTDSVVTPASPTASVLTGAALYVDPYSNARRTADEWKLTRPADATQMEKIAASPQAKWFGNWNTNVAADVDALVTRVSGAAAVPVLVAYNIPQRDCGGLSGGNATSIDQYKSWINAFAAGIGNRRAVVILEPDALAAMDCLSAGDQQTRVSLLSYAVNALRALAATSVYLDAGHAHWQSASVMATRLSAAGIANAAGFSLNVSNFVSDADNIDYGRQLSTLVSGKHFVIDSGRNGLGPTADGQWCNPSGRALGTRPTTATGIAGLDAFLWIKNPGESDGACNGAPAAGAWIPEYALGLAQRAAY